MQRAKTTDKKVEDFNTLKPLLAAMYAEFQELSKKKQDGQVGAKKVKMVNRLLNAVHNVLEHEPNRSFLDLLDEDDLTSEQRRRAYFEPDRSGPEGFRGKVLLLEWNEARMVRMKSFLRWP